MASGTRSRNPSGADHTDQPDPIHSASHRTPVPPMTAMNPLLSLQALSRGLGYVPDKGEPGAPKTFKGDANRLDEFLDKVDKIIAGCGTTSSADKVRILFGYLGGEAKAFVREQPTYKEPDYADLVRILREAYPSPKHKFRYDSRDLERVAARFHGKKLKYLEDLAEYQRRFEKVGLWLVNNHKIEDARYNRLFWDGLPTDWQNFLKNNGDKHGLKIDPSETPRAEAVLQAMRRALSYENFDTDLLYRKRSKKSSQKSRRSKHQDTDSTSGMSSDSESDTSVSDDDSDSDSDSKSGRDRKKSRSKKNHEKDSSSTFMASALERMLQSVKDKANTRAPEHPSAAARVETSIDELVRRLKGFDTGSTEYMVTWADLVRIAPHVASAVAAPTIGHQAMPDTWR
ncbi:hypothetical protein OC861_005279 [Tilletia horrida]|nr:hypothetical protein OC861_005279 [Tilletia horrida]